MKLRGEKPMKYVGDYVQRETIKNHIFHNKKDKFESFVLDIMGQMIEDFYYGYSLEFDLLLKEYFNDFVSSLVNRIAVFILEEGFMQRLSEAVLRCDYDIYEEEVNSVLLYWAPKRVDVISEEYRFWEDEN